MNLRSEIKTSVLLLIGALIYTIFFQTFYYWMRYFTPWPYASMRQFFVCLSYNYLPTLFLMISAWLVVFKIPYYGIGKFTHWLRNILLLTFIMIVSNFLFYFFTHEFVDWGGTCFNTLLIWIFSEWFYYSRKYRSAYNDLQNRKHELETLRFDLYKSKINPHFLFNSLAILHSFIKTQSKSAERFTILLSRFYQSTLQHIDMIETPIDMELSVLSHYLELLKVLYGDNLSVIIEIEPDVDISTITTVSMGLQLLAENVVRHNEITAKHPITIHILVTKSETVISNSIQPKLSTVESTRWSHNYLTHVCNRHNKHFTAGKVNQFIYRAIIPHLN